MRRTDDVTNPPLTDARPSRLHRRLTVALASPADRARLAELIAGDLGALEADGTSPLVRSEDLWLAADGFAGERAEARRAERARLDVIAARATHDCDTARLQLEHLQGASRTLVEGATWALSAKEELAELEADADAARHAVDEARQAQRAAQQHLERVLEQRTAADAAIEAADAELSEVIGSGLDESDLRRELEAAGQAARDAAQAHAAALSRLEELQIERTGLDVRAEALQPLAAVVQLATTNEHTLVEAVRDALGSLQAVTIDGEVDKQAHALADAWEDLLADLAKYGPSGDGPTPAELNAARARAEVSARRLAELDAASAASVLTEAERAELDAAHAAVLEAEEATERRRVTSGARRRLDEAHEAESALLASHGFATYLDVVLTGGRSAAADPARAEVEREAHEAARDLAALERTGEDSPEVEHLTSERDRLLAHATELLGVDPGDQVVSLLRSHRPVSPLFQADLVAALEAVGLRPVGIALEEAALAFLEANPLPEDDEGEDEGEAEAEEPDGQGIELARETELAEVEARTSELVAELHAAEAEVDRTAEALQMAERSVGAFEGELTQRADEDASRLQRFAAAEELRAQIEAVVETLEQAESGARADLATSEEGVEDAEVAHDAAAAAVTALARRARELAAELPIDQRPGGDVLASLDLLAERLQQHVEVVQPEIDRAEAAAAGATVVRDDAVAAAEAVGTGDDGPLAEDLRDGLQQVLGAAPGDTLLVLDEPFVGVDVIARTELLELVRSASATRPLVLLTEDADVLGWAIELPVDEATAVPADALLARLTREDDPPTPAPPPLAPVPAVAPAPRQAAPVDITTTTTDPQPAPARTARRWAGQR